MHTTPPIQSLAYMYFNDEIKVLKDIPVASKDGKLLMPALFTLFQEFSKVCHEKDEQTYNLKLTFCIKKLRSLVGKLMTNIHTNVVTL